MRRLILRPGAIGDCILSLPALECLRAGYTEIWAAGPNLPLLRGFDAARSIAGSGLDLLGIPGVEPPEALIERLRSFDSIVSWYGANRPEFRAAAEGLRLPVVFFPALPPADSRMHACDYFLAQARTLSPRPVPAVPRIECPRRRGGFAVIHPFSGSASKNWPVESFRRVAELLAARMPVRWCAGPEEKLADAVRFGNLYDLACWLATARVYIGNDSGPTHLAAAVGTRTIALFGPTDPAVWAPRGEDVSILTFADATPERVAALALA